MIQFASPACERVLGRSAESLVDTDWFALAHDEDRERLRAEFGQGLGQAEVHLPPQLGQRLGLAAEQVVVLAIHRHHRGITVTEQPAGRPPPRTEADQQNPLALQLEHDCQTYLNFSVLKASTAKRIPKM